MASPSLAKAQGIGIPSKMEVASSFQERNCGHSPNDGGPNELDVLSLTTQPFGHVLRIDLFKFRRISFLSKFA